MSLTPWAATSIFLVIRCPKGEARMTVDPVTVLHASSSVASGGMVVTSIDEGSFFREKMIRCLFGRWGKKDTIFGFVIQITQFMDITLNFL